MKLKPFFIFLLLLTSSVIIFTGCFFSKHVKKVNGITRASDKDLKKKIAIIFFDNKSEHHKKISDKLNGHLFASISDDCDNIILLDDNEGNIKAKFSNLPTLYSDKLDNLFLVPAGRKLGLNAVVFITPDLIDRKKTTGFFMFKKNLEVRVLEVRAVAYDMGTGTKLLDKVFSDEIDIGYDDLSVTSYKENFFDLFEYGDIIKDIADQLFEDIDEKISSVEWKSYIIEKHQNNAVIFAGKEMGVTEGDILNIYDANSTIISADKQHFFIPGLKIGTLKITSTDDDISEAVILAGEENISVGNIVEYIR